MSLTEVFTCAVCDVHSANQIGALYAKLPISYIYVYKY